MSSTTRYPLSRARTAPCSICLRLTRDGRLAILELKAGEDLHFPLQGLDYWIRVHWLQQQRSSDGAGELERNGYFPGLSIFPTRLCCISSSRLSRASLHEYRATTPVAEDCLDADRSQRGLAHRAKGRLPPA